MVIVKNKIDNEKGLTLLEVLLSITLLSIVMITFLSFFTNAFRFNSINDDSIQAMNIAREQQALIKGKLWNEITAFTFDNTTGCYIQNTNEREYDIKMSIKKEPETIDSYRNLHLVHVEVTKDGKPLSETYTYYEGTVRNNQ